jgi:uncharacterized protein YndB with AHSA1/START domain
MSTKEDSMAKIHQEVTLSASPKTVYRALMNAAEHAKFTGAPAEIDESVGGAWSAHGGKISGRNVELVPDARIVQTWRAGNWPAGTHSIVRFELKPEGTGTKLVFDHDAVPDDQAAHLEGGWGKMYWEPLRTYLSA